MVQRLESGTSITNAIDSPPGAHFGSVGVSLTRVTWDEAPSASIQRTKSCVPLGDRKSTRLNSSHTVISYAVFCSKKILALIRPAPARGGPLRGSGAHIPFRAPRRLRL